MRSVRITVSTKYLPILLWVFVGAVAAAIPFGVLIGDPVLRQLLAPFSLHIANEKAIYSPAAYFVLLTACYLLERKMPVNPRDFLSASFRYDLLWYFGNVCFNLAFLGYFALWLNAFYQHYLSFLTIGGVSDWHPMARFALGVLLTDFTRWLSHLIRHKVPAFWAFHAVHHSQTELNIFTDARGHPVDSMVSTVIRFLPMMMFGNPVPVIMAWLVFETVYPKFYHANVRINLGPLRYLLVTPQSHRVHHGLDRIYRDKNFGFTFSVWDRLFGTQFADDTVYPATGIEGKAFPHESGTTPRSQLRSFARQLIYPFRSIAQPGVSSA